MRNLFLKFFYVPKYGKVHECVLSARLVVTITVVILCLAMMSITAYAYFTHDVTSNFNTIQAASFEAKVQITDENHTPVTAVKNGKLQTATLDSGTYIVELSKGVSTAKTGFCIVTIGNTQYYTQQIGVDVQRNLNDANVTFTLKVSSATTVKILSHWGTSSCYGYKETNTNPVFLESGDDIDLTTSGTANNETPSNQEQGSSESTITPKPSETPSQESATPSTEPTEATTDVTESSSATEETTESTKSAETTASTEGQPDSQLIDTSTTEGNNE